MKKASLGKGRKSCSNCGTILAAAARKCVCGHVFGDKERAKRRARIIKQRDAVAKEIAVVNELGGIAAARRVLEETKDRVAKFEVLGGLDEAEASLNLLENLAGVKND